MWNAPYADSMRAVYDLAPDDLDVATLYADALMNLTPWQLWDVRTGEPAEGARTPEARAVLERALGTPGGRGHPGVLHLYVHLMEMSPTPETALPAADRMRRVPDAGPLLHMPSHLEVLCGDYRRVVADNSAAIAADEKFHARAGVLLPHRHVRAGAGGHAVTLLRHGRVRPPSRLRPARRATTVR